MMMSPDPWGQRSAERAAASAFRRAFGSDPVVGSRAPGRVLLVGEDTAYADGLVLAIAMEREVRIAARPREDSRVRLVSAEGETPAEFDAAADPGSLPGALASAVARVARSLGTGGREIRGFDGALAGSVPTHLGLASSTAVTVAAAVLFRAISELELDDPALARVCAEAEADPADARGAVVDALTALAAQPGGAVWVDALDLSVRTVPIPAALRVVVLDSGVSREPVGPEYAKRREECERAVAAIREHDPETASLRDVSPEEIERWEQRLPPTLAKRMRHIVGENERVKLAAAALGQNETERFGELIFAAHRSLRDDCELHAPELDALVEMARGAPGVVGARMMGSARGTVNVVAAAWVDEFVERVQHRYQERYGTRPEAYVTSAGAGAGVARLARG